MIIYGIANNEQEEKVVKRFGATTIIPTESLGNWLEFADPNNMCLIVAGLSSLGDTTNKVATNLQTLNNKGIGFKSIREDIDSSCDNYEQIVSIVNSIKDVYVQEKKTIAEQLRDQKRQLGGQKQGAREEFTFPPNWEEQYDLMITGVKSKTQVAEYYGVSRVSIYSWINRWEKQLANREE